MRLEITTLLALKVRQIFGSQFDRQGCACLRKFLNGNFANYDDIPVWLQM